MVAKAEATAPSAATSRRMRAQRQRDTAPEVALRRRCHAMGLRYFVDYRLPIAGVRRRADMAFPALKVAVFVDGCFWHACPQHGTQPRSNAQWWRSKLRANVARDRDSDNRLAECGWIVVRIWEHEPADKAAHHVADVVGRRRGGGKQPR